jgi:hypothetical protein
MKVAELFEARIKYKRPDFQEEWNEAQRYPELKKLGKQGWIKLVNDGQIVNSKTLLNIGNIDLDLSGLDKAKLARAEASINKGEVELPIVVKINGKYDLLGGNTRFAYMKSKGINPIVWLIKI